MRWVSGVSIGEEGGKFWPWHRDRDQWFTIGHHRIGAAVVPTCKDCGVILAAPTNARGRKTAAIKQHDALHEQLAGLHEQVAYLYQALQITIGEPSSGDTDQSPEGGYFEPGYDVRDAGPGPDSGDDG